MSHLTQSQLFLQLENLVQYKLDIRLFCCEVINTLWTGDADLRLYITTVQDG